MEKWKIESTDQIWCRVNLKWAVASDEPTTSTNVLGPKNVCATNFLYIITISRVGVLLFINWLLRIIPLYGLDKPELLQSLISFLLVPSKLPSFLVFHFMRNCIHINTFFTIYSLHTMVNVENIFSTWKLNSNKLFEFHWFWSTLAHGHIFFKIII